MKRLCFYHTTPSSQKHDILECVYIVSFHFLFEPAITASLNVYHYHRFASTPAGASLLQLAGAYLTIILYFFVYGLKALTVDDYRSPTLHISGQVFRTRFEHAGEVLHCMFLSWPLMILVFASVHANNYLCVRVCSKRFSFSDSQRCHKRPSEPWLSLPLCPRK
jgi:hypothetical protein